MKIVSIIFKQTVLKFQSATKAVLGKMDILNHFEVGLKTSPVKFKQEILNKKAIEFVH